MFPQFQLFGRTIPTYAVMAVIGILLCGVFSCQSAKKRNLDDNTVIELFLWSCPGILIGSHLLYALINLEWLGVIFAAENARAFRNGVYYLFGGSVFYGGLIGGLLSGFLFLKIKKLDFDIYSDLCAPAIPLFHGFARIGCFLGGCCYGIESRFGIVYTHSLVTQANHVRRFPIQLLESLCNFLLFFLLWQLFARRKAKGKLLSLYLFLYSILRFCDEFLRGDVARKFIWIFSTSQWISLFLFLISGIYLLQKHFSSRKSQE